MIPEKKVVKALVDGVEAMGGMCEVFNPTGQRGRPDRLCTLPQPVGMRLVELKRPDGEVKSWQDRDHKRRLSLGVHVRVAYTIEDVDQLLRQWRLQIAERRQSNW